MLLQLKWKPRRSVKVKVWVSEMHQGSNTTYCYLLAFYGLFLKQPLKEIVQNWVVWLQISIKTSSMSILSKLCLCVLQLRKAIKGSRLNKGDLQWVVCLCNIQEMDLSSSSTTARMSSFHIRINNCSLKEVLFPVLTSESADMDSELDDDAWLTAGADRRNGDIAKRTYHTQRHGLKDLTLGLRNPWGRTGSLARQANLHPSLKYIDRWQGKGSIVIHALEENLPDLVGEDASKLSSVDRRRDVTASAPDVTLVILMHVLFDQSCHVSHLIVHVHVSPVALISWCWK